MKYYFLILLILFPTTLLAEKQGKARADSLLQELNSNRFLKEDTNRARLLNNISYAIHNNNPDEGLRYAYLSLELAKKLRWQKGIGLAYNSLYASHSTKSEYDKAREFCIKSLKIFEEINEPKSIAVNLGNIAECYGAQGDYPKALTYEFDELKIAESLSDMKLTAACEMNIGSTYMSMSQYNKAQQYFFKSLKKNEQLNDKEIIAQCYINIANCYYSQYMYDDALKYCFKSLEIFESLEEEVGIETALTSAAAIYKFKNNFARSLELELRAMEINKKLGNKYGEALNYNNIGLTYLQLVEDKTIPDSSFANMGTTAAKLSKAIAYLENSERICTEISSRELLIHSYEALAIAYRLAGRYDDAIEKINMFIKLKDSVFSDDNRLKIASLETQRETQLKEKQIEINRLLANEKRNEQTIFIVGIALLSIVAIIVIRSYNAQSKVNKANVALLLQKDILMKEIHHRVKNNLQVISTLLDLQMNSISDEHARDAMTESATRVKSISLIHQQLYQNENLNTIKFATFTEDLMNQITTVFKKSGLQISLKSEFPETEIDIDTAVPLGLILNELMTNSYKHAFNSVPSGVIEVSMQKVGGQFRLTYKDSGPGLPENMDVNTLNSLGMKLIGRLCKQIGGKLSYIKADNTFAIAFNDAATRKLVD